MSARTVCPDCESTNIFDLINLLYSPRVDYFRCTECNCMWMVSKGKDEPAIRAVFGNREVDDALKKQAG